MIPIQYKNAASDAKFRGRILSLYPDLDARCKQIVFFQQHRGVNCSYFNTGVKLLLMEIKHRGCILRDNKILSPEGDQLWPTITNP